MILTLELANALWDDRVLITNSAAPPSKDKYGNAKIGSVFKIIGLVEIEERSGIYKVPYTPSVGGVKFSGLSSIGMMSYSYSPLPEPMSIGRYCSISSGLCILDSHHPLDAVTSSIITFRPNNPLCHGIDTDGLKKKVKWHIRNWKSWPNIDHDVWIGRDVTLSLGVSIGTGAVIAARSVVTRNVDPYSIIGGNPARHIRYRIEDSVLRSEMLQTEWWNYHPSDVIMQNIEDPKVFVQSLNKSIAGRSIYKYMPTKYVLSDKTIERRAGYYVER